MNLTEEMVVKCQEIATRASINMSNSFKELFMNDKISDVDQATLCVIPIVSIAYFVAQKCFGLAGGYEEQGNPATPEGVFNMINKMAVNIFNDMKRDK